MSNHDNDDLPVNLSANEHFQSVVERVVSRRGLLKAGVGLGAVAFLGGALVGCGGSSSSNDTDGRDTTPPPPAPLLGFTAVPANSGDAVVVPAGYTAAVLAPWGAKVFANSPEWKPDGSNTAAEQARQVGDSHDGMHFFPLNDSSTEGLLVVNHEATSNEYLYGADYTLPTWTEEMVRKSQAAHGISVLHIKKSAAGVWEVQLDSTYNRRLDANSLMTLTGPARGDALMTTSADLAGTWALGTLNNCGNGVTPWGTYLTCEENFNGYFGGSTTPAAGTPLRRYGLSAGGFGYRWHEQDDRFNYEIEPNEPNRHGWMVEIDPFDPTSIPKKRTALGRFKHENAAVTLTADKRVVVYMGDDEVHDYIYKFVSDGRFDPLNPIGNRNLLDSGKLYVAKFLDGAATGDGMGDGEWILLEYGQNGLDETATPPFNNQAEVLIWTRLAGDVVGATKMDRPEWVAVHPDTGEVYCTLTNNSSRTVTDDANPRVGNNYGQIVRWREAGGDAAAETFEWDLFVLAGNPIEYPDDSRAGSSNVTVDNTFNSPDGLAFDADGRLWIQTDGDFSNASHYTGQGNNQMLAADPVSKEIRRFLVGPAGCEITGITWSPDHTSMFVNVQHPGETGGHPNRPADTGGLSMGAYLAANPTSFTEWPESQWAGTGGGRPRSATVVITKDDGGVIGT